ncbi:MAG: DUF4282 domain-containing protein [Asticcacaulis sp.]
MNRVINKAFGKSKPKDLFLDLLTFNRLMTRPVIHIIYWAGLALITLALFGVIGGAAGIAIREETPWGFFLALPFLVGGSLFILVALLLWRSFCEFYVAIFRIAEDLRFLRVSAEQTAQPASETPAASAETEADKEDNVLESPFYSTPPHS